MSTPPRRGLPNALRLLLTAGLAAVAIAGCGGSSSHSQSSSTHTSTVPPPGPLKTTAINLPGGVKGVWGNPTNGAMPKALLILIHGGSWTGLDPVAFQSTIATAAVFQGIGYETLTVDYRAGAQGIDDVDQIYRIARQRVGSKFPICAIGVSAGGHIALMLAVRNPDLACVIDLAGPTDLPGFRQEPNGAQGYRIAVGAFGRDQLAPLSPALHAGSIKAKLLMLYARTDHLVPVQQGYAMARADPHARLIVLPPGTAPFVHTGIGAPVQATGVDAAAYQRAQQTEVGFLDAVVRAEH
jgi:acetyl esterase/lipase